MKFIVTVISCILLFGCYSQGNTQYIFVEPNISVNLDTSLFLVETEVNKTNVDFISVRSKQDSSMIILMSSFSDYSPTTEELDQLLDKAIENGMQKENDTFQVIPPIKPFRYNSFYGIEYLIRTIETNNYFHIFKLNSFWEGGTCELFYTVPYNQKPNNLKYSSIEIKDFINKIRKYSKSNLALINQQVISSLEIEIDSIERPDFFYNFLERTYFGSISTNPKYVLLEASMEDGKAPVFRDFVGEELFINFNDFEKGIITKKMELTVLDSLSRKVVIPFILEYNNIH